jgi:phosphatidylglycerophosphatase A
VTAAALALATVFGVGCIPVAPGTFGSAAGLLVWTLLPAAPVVHAGTMAIVFVIGSWAGGISERHYQRTDPGQVVIDEVLGMLITLFLNPVGWRGAVVALVLFRAADVIKPYPANRLERLPGGIGVMADDAMAAIYANLALRGGLLLWNRLTG